MPWCPATRLSASGAWLCGPVGIGRRRKAHPPVRLGDDLAGEREPVDLAGDRDEQLVDQIEPRLRRVQPDREEIAAGGRFGQPGAEMRERDRSLGGHDLDRTASAGGVRAEVLLDQEADVPLRLDRRGRPSRPHRCARGPGATPHEYRPFAEQAHAWQPYAPCLPRGRDPHRRATADPRGATTSRGVTKSDETLRYRDIIIAATREASRQRRQDKSCREPRRLTMEKPSCTR